MVSQCFAGVFPAVSSTFLQYGDDLVDKLAEIVGHGRGRDIESVATGFIEHGFHLVSDLFRGANNLRAPDRRSVDLPDLAHGQFILA